jgi:predicted Zn-dependent protease with MMP-like domain
MTRPPLHRYKGLLRPRVVPRPTQPCSHIDSSRKTRQEKTSREEFTRLVARALDTLPDEIIEKLENVAVTIEEQPSSEVLEEMGLASPDNLFGLYRGVPRPWRSIFAPLSEFPDKIEIYYQPIVRACTRPHEIRDLVRRVVVHEVGHHFGMSDQQLRALGY